MSAVAWNIAPSTTTVAADSRWWDSVDNAPGGLVGKMYPLPAFNAVLAGGTWAEVVREVVSQVTARGFSDVDDLRGQLPGIIADAWERFQDDATDYGLAPDLCVFWLLTAGKGWLLGNDNGFDPIPLPEGLWCDPEIHDGGCKVGEPFKGDDQLVQIVRRQRAKREKPSGHPIGGYVTRATITRDGIDLKRIGDLEQPGDAPAASNPSVGLSNRKVGRNDPCPCGSGRKAKKCCGT